MTALALDEWSRAPDDRPWPRMNALWALHRVGSPALDARLAEAEASSNDLLKEYAEGMRRGDVES